MIAKIHDAVIPWTFDDRMVWARFVGHPYLPSGNNY
jgi:hypothetical protein